MEPFIPIIKPFMGEAEADAARRPILKGWVTQGPEVQQFEEEFAAFVGAPHACAVSNCTTALHLALHVVGVRPCDEVITASHSYIATANAVRYCGATPVFVDIEPSTFNLDPRRVREVISPRTRAVLCVHQMGMPCDLSALLEITARAGIPLIEDAACAIGSEIRLQKDWERIGRPHGALACFSFHPRKILTTGDGGMITTTNADYVTRLRELRQHGMSVPANVRHASRQVTFETYNELGFNYRMTDIQAAIGREQLKRVPEVVAWRRDRAARYARLLADIPGVQAPTEPEWARTNWQSYCIRLADDLDQRAVMQSMLDANVATRRGVMCAHREPAYQHEPWSCGSGPGACGCQPGTCRQLPHSEHAQEHCILLPLYQQFTDELQDRVVRTLADAVTRARN